MNDAQLIDRLAQTDAYSAGVSVPAEIWTSDVALHEIERRSKMQTQERKIESAADTPAGAGRRRRRWLVPALAAGLAVVIAVVAAVVLAGSTDEPLPDVVNPSVPTSVPESAPLTLLEIGEALNQAVITGDWKTERMLYAEDATYTDEVLAASFAFGNAPESASVLEPAAAYNLFPPVNVFDWDEDGTPSILDWLTSHTMAYYAAGVTTRHSCTEVDASTLRCEVLGEGHPFLAAAGSPGITNTYTVVDGRITGEAISAPIDSVASSSALRQYHDWVRLSHPELDVDDDLFKAWGSLLITPSTVEMHRQFIAEWKAQG